ncbi:MAG: UDP-N-acetylglucosamine 1-carboxyvinyltransferase, partial [Acutalibacteraceae bacterium]|nr:UDP-N-acetylglucosamine 1-carboxyvinyltransferase [Acutalibacteraceae bacterium]
MTEYIINGKNRLSGKLKLQGSKNASLPVLAATLLTRSKCVIHNCPDLSDVRQSLNILTALGCDCTYNDNTAVIDSTNAFGTEINEQLMCAMRSSIIFLGAILSANGKATVSRPGGCELGPRPID